MTLFEFLKTALAERRQTIPQFARTCGVSGQLAYKWLAEDPEQRIVPSPMSCEKIASALGADSDYVLELAGHRKPRGEHVPMDPDIAAISAVWPSLEGGIQHAIRILAGIHGVTVPGENGFSAARRGVTRRKRGSDGQLPERLPRLHLTLAHAR